MIKKIEPIIRKYCKMLKIQYKIKNDTITLYNSNSKCDLQGMKVLKSRYVTIIIHVYSDCKDATSIYDKIKALFNINNIPYEEHIYDV